MSNEIHCPKCNSTQIVANKKGFSGKKAVVGAVLTGGIGIVAGTFGSKKIIITCLACGHQFKPGQGTDGKQTPVKNIPSQPVALSDFDNAMLALKREKGIIAVVETLEKDHGYTHQQAVDYSIKLRDPNAPVSAGCVIAIIFIIIVVLYLINN